MKANIKKTLVLVLALMLAVFACACGGGGIQENSDPVSSYDSLLVADDMAKYFVNNITFVDSMEPVADDIALELYGILAEDVDNVEVYMSTGATAEEVAVMVVESDEKAAIVQAAMENRVAAQIAGFENYVPGEVEKLSKPVIMQLENALVLIVADDTDEVSTAIETYVNTYLIK